MSNIKTIYTIGLLFCLFSCSPTELITDDFNEKVPEETKDVIPPTVHELLSYFSLNQQMNVNQVLERINIVRGKKTINNKELDIQEVVNTSQKEDLGTLYIKVTGTVNSVNFSADYTLDGFVKKPTDYQMASRTILKWKESYKDAPYLLDIAFDELYRLEDASKFTAIYLSQWIDFYSSLPTGESYLFTTEDIKLTTITDVKYSNDAIHFNVTYNNIAGNNTSITFDKNRYYQSKLTLNVNYTKNYYLEGVYEHLDDFFTEAILFDSNIYQIELVSGSKNIKRNTNLIECRLVLKTVAGVELADFEYLLKGFKPILDLRKEWKISSTASLENYISSRLISKPDGDVTALLSSSISNWIKKSQFSIERNGVDLELRLTEGMLNGIQVDTYVANDRKANYLDIRLLDPKFELVSAIKENNKVRLTVSMLAVNELPLSDIKSIFEVEL